MVIEKLALAALVILVASESFAVSEAVLWAVTAALHMSAAAALGVFMASLAVGSGAGFGIYRLAQNAKKSGNL